MSSASAIRRKAARDYIFVTLKLPTCTSRL